MPEPGTPRPLRLSWWVAPGRLLAGAYPGHPAPEIARRQIGALLDADIRCFVDLMDEGPRGAPPYAPLLRELAEARGHDTECLHLPIEDHDVPAPDALRALEARIDDRLVRGVGVYVHCWGGRGRTGIVGGVALIRLGAATSEGFEDEIRRRRSGLSGRSPETDAQSAFVRSYTEGTPLRWRSAAAG